MPIVSPGSQVYPVMSSKNTPSTPAEHGAVTDITATFAGENLLPRRLQIWGFYSREDRAMFPQIDSALRMNFSGGLSDGLDAHIIAGDSEGLLHATNLPNHNVNAETTFELYRSQLLYGRVDGRYAASPMDIRILMGAESYGHAGGKYRGNNADYGAADALARDGGGVRVSAHIPAAASNKQNVIVRRGMRMDAVAPVWEGVTLIPDEITKAANGQIVLTAVMLFAVKILRADAFYKQQVQIA